MALATITGHRSDLAGLADKSDKLWFVPTVPSEDVLSPRRVPAAIGDDGSFTIQLHPGPASVTLFNKSVPFVVPNDGGTYTLWSRIRATITLPPETTQSKLVAAVSEYITSGAGDLLTEAVAATTYAPVDAYVIFRDQDGNELPPGSVTTIVINTANGEIDDILFEES